jgi:hypothetical protein
MAFSPISSRKKQFTGTGLSGPFTYDKYLTPESNFRVIKTISDVDTTLVLDTDYTVELVKSSNGTGFLSANITLVVALEDEEILTVETFLDYEQSLDLVNGTVFDLDDFETALDKSALLSAQLSTQLTTTLRVAESSTITNTAISGLTPNFYLRVNSAGTSFETVNVVDLLLQSSLTPSSNNFIVGTGSAFASTTAANTRTALGLGTLPLQASSSVTITGGLIQGITDLTVADGGTGASDATTARSNLGLAIGTNVQAYSADLAGLAAYNTSAMLFRTASGTYVGRSLAGATGFTVTNGSGVSGNPSIAYNIGALTEETSPLITDMVLEEKGNGTVAKVAIQNLPSYNTVGAPASGDYTTISATGSLTSERTIAGSNGLLLTDAGANSTLTASVDINGRTVDGSPDTTADFTPTYDVSASANKKALLDNVKGLPGSWTLVSSQNFSAVSTVSITSGITSTYNVYALVLSSAVNTTADFSTITFSTDGGATYVETMHGNMLKFIASTTTLGNVSGTSSSFVRPFCTDAYGANTTGGLFVWYFFNLASSTGAALLGDGAVRTTSGVIDTMGGMYGGRFNNSSAINAIRLSMGANGSGRLTLYGLN